MTRADTKMGLTCHIPKPPQKPRRQQIPISPARVIRQELSHVDEQNLIEEVATSQTPNDISEELLLKYSDGVLGIMNILLHYSYNVLRKQI
jgi:hypothetical protein